MKRTQRIRENICKSHINWDISRIYRKLLQVNKKKEIYLSCKMDNLNINDSKEDIHMTNKQLISAYSKVHQGNANKNSIGFYFTTTYVAIFKKTDSTKCWWKHKDIRTLICCSWSPVHCWLQNNTTIFENNLVVHQIVKHRVTIRSTNSIYY